MSLLQFWSSNGEKNRSGENNDRSASSQVVGSNKTKCSRRKDHAAVSGRYRWRWWSGTRALALHYISRSELSGSIGDAYEPRVSDIKYAFLYGTHKRLGAKSFVLMLPVDVIGEIPFEEERETQINQSFQSTLFAIYQVISKTELESFSTEIMLTKAEPDGIWKVKWCCWCWFCCCWRTISPHENGKPDSTECIGKPMLLLLLTPNMPPDSPI